MTGSVGPGGALLRVGTARLAPLPPLVGGERFQATRPPSRRRTMPNFAANLTLLFTELPFLERFQAAAEAGFRGVEFLFPYEHPPDALQAQIEQHNLTVALFNLPPGNWQAGERGIAALPGHEADFEHSLEATLEYAKATGAGRMHVMAGMVAKDEHPAARDTFVRNLRNAAPVFAKHGLDLLIEPLNPQDMPGYFLSRIDEAVAILDEVGESNLKLQFDLYHRQMTEGNVVRGLREHFPRIGHIQIANVPGRHEPDFGELNYPFLFDVLDELGYDGWVGCEYKPRAGTVSGLGWFRALPPG